MSTATSKDKEPRVAVIILYQLCFCYKCADKFMAKTVNLAGPSRPWKGFRQ